MTVTHPGLTLLICRGCRIQVVVERPSVSPRRNKHWDASFRGCLECIGRVVDSYRNVVILMGSGGGQVPDWGLVAGSSFVCTFSCFPTSFLCTCKTDFYHTLAHRDPFVGSICYDNLDGIRNPSFGTVVKCDRLSGAQHHLSYNAFTVEIFHQS